MQNATACLRFAVVLAILVPHFRLFAVDAVRVNRRVRRLAYLPILLQFSQHQSVAHFYFCRIFATNY